MPCDAFKTHIGISQTYCINMLGENLVVRPRMQIATKKKKKREKKTESLENRSNLQILRVHILR